MQELAETGARLAAPPVPAAGLVLGHQARGLQGLLDERIAEAHAMLAPGELVEMPDVEPQIPLAIEREHALHLGDRGALGRGGLPAAVQETVVPEMLQAPNGCAGSCGDCSPGCRRPAPRSSAGRWRARASRPSGSTTSATPTRACSSPRARRSPTSAPSSATPIRPRRSGS